MESGGEGTVQSLNQYTLMLENFKREGRDMKNVIAIIIIAALAVPFLDAPAAIVRGDNAPVPLSEAELALCQGGKLAACISSLMALGGAIGGYGAVVAAAAGPIGWGLGVMIVGSWVALAGAGVATGYNC